MQLERERPLCTTQTRTAAGIAPAVGLKPRGNLCRRGREDLPRRIGVGRWPRARHGLGKDALQLPPTAKQRASLARQNLDGSARKSLGDQTALVLVQIIAGAVKDAVKVLICY